MSHGYGFKTYTIFCMDTDGYPSVCNLVQSNTNIKINNLI